MGILSEIDMMNRDAEDDAFEVSSDSETVDSFSEEFEPVETQKQEPQAEDAEEARKKAEEEMFGGFLQEKDLLKENQN